MISSLDCEFSPLCPLLENCTFHGSEVIGKGVLPPLSSPLSALRSDFISDGNSVGKPIDPCLAE